MIKIPFDDDNKLISWFSWLFFNVGFFFLMGSALRDVATAVKNGIISDIRIRFNGISTPCFVADEEAGYIIRGDSSWPCKKLLDIVLKIEYGDVWILMGDRK